MSTCKELTVVVEAGPDELRRLRSENLRLKHELSEALITAKSERQNAEMYASAWVRELGGKLFRKAHHIDACVVTTRWMKERSDRLAVIEADMKHKAMEAEYGPHIEQVKARREVARG